MRQPKENSEFRQCHAAQAALERYIASGRNIDIIKQIGINDILRYDVWQCIFEKERAAYAILQEKEIYFNFKAYGDSYSDAIDRINGTICVTILERIVEFDLPLSLERAIKIMLDIKGDKFIKVLKSEAKISFNRRRKIIAPYFKRDKEWLNYVKTVVEALDKFSSDNN